MSIFPCPGIWPLGLTAAILLTGCRQAESVAPNAVASSTARPISAGFVPVHVALRQALPAYVESVQARGLDAEGKLVYGPLTLARSAPLELPQVPTGVTRLEVEARIGSTVLASVGTAVRLTEVASLTLEDVALQPVHSLRSLRLNSNQVALPDGEEYQFAAQGVFSDGHRYDLSRLVDWQSSEPSVLSVSQQGQALARQLGTARLSCWLDRLSAQATVAVTAPRLESLRVTPERPALPTLTTQAFEAEGLFSDGSSQNLSSRVEWSCSQPEVAAMDPTGVVATQGVGTTLIVARLGEASASTELLVSGPSVVNLSLGPPQIQPVETVLTLHALATLSDGSTRDVSPLVLWNSTVPEVLSWTGPGQADVVNPGLTTVLASFAGLQASLDFSTPAAAAAQASSPDERVALPLAQAPSPPQLQPGAYPPPQAGPPLADDPGSDGGFFFYGGGFGLGGGHRRPQRSLGPGNNSFQTRSFAFGHRR